MSMVKTACVSLLLCWAAASWGEESLVVVPGRIPYLGETVGHVVVTMLPDNAGEKLTLRVTADGKALGTGPVVPGQRSTVEIPLAELAYGTTLLHCKLMSSGKEVASSDVELVKLPFKANAAQIDNRRRGLIVDGLPFFPFGFVHNPDGPPAGDPAIPPEFAAQGFNLYSPYSLGEGMEGLDKVRVWMDACAASGVKVLFDLIYNALTPSPNTPWTQKEWQTARTLIEGVRDHPALLAYYIADEPYDRDLEQLSALRRLVKELDPYHPVTIVNYEGPPGRERWSEWRKVSDVTWLDLYPVNVLSRDQSSNPYWGSIPPDAQRSVATFTAYWLASLDRKHAYSTPLWYNPQTFGGGAVGGGPWDNTKREPSPQELRAFTYAALTSGATALVCWTYTPWQVPTSPRLMNEASNLAQEVMEMTPFLLSEEPHRTATVTGANVLTGAWQDRGMVLVAAVNADSTPTRLKLALQNSKYSGPAEVLFENRQLEVRSGAIDDFIDAQGTRVYQIPEGPFPADMAPLSPENLRENASFEESVSVASPPDVCAKRSRGSTCFLDGRTAVNGRRSLRMTAADAKGVELLLNAVGQYSIFEGTKLQPGKRYRVSIWAKADRPGLDLALKVFHTDRADWQHFPLGTDWKEYSTVVTLQSTPHNTMAPALKLSGPGTVWVDLLQVVPAE